MNAPRWPCSVADPAEAKELAGAREQAEAKARVEAQERVEAPARPRFPVVDAAASASWTRDSRAPVSQSTDLMSLRYEQPSRR